MDLVQTVHSYLVGELAGGAASESIKSHYSAMRIFYGFADTLDHNIDEGNLRPVFKQWVNHLNARVSGGQLLADTAYHQGKSVAALFAGALEVPFVSIAKGSRLKKPKNSKSILGTQADKQNLRETQGFGWDLIDMVDSLTLEKCMGPLPVTLTLRSTPSPYELWCGIPPPESVKAVTDAQNRPFGSAKIIRVRREMRSLQPTFQQRRKAINLRISAEFLVFIAQTGMNRAQAMAVTIGDFRYESWQDGYLVRKYKGRKQGEVEFEIFSEYRQRFEEYLEFRKSVILDESVDALFPVLSLEGLPPGSVFNFENVRRLLDGLNRPFFSPQKLRCTRINWLLRATDDPALVAQMSQHDVSTLHRNYEKPNHQRAAIEWTTFYRELDSTVMSAPAPGGCATREPQRAAQFTEDSPEPDCRNPAGCLFCVFYRGIETFDYAWSMFSYRWLKRLELALYLRADANKAKNSPLLVIERITDVMKTFADRSQAHAKWVEESNLRIEEADYHPRWAGFILLAEALT